MCCLNTWLGIARICGNNDRLIASRAYNSRCAPLAMDVLYEHAYVRVNACVHTNQDTREDSHTSKLATTAAALPVVRINRSTNTQKATHDMGAPCQQNTGGLPACTVHRDRTATQRRAYLIVRPYNGILLSSNAQAGTEQSVRVREASGNFSSFGRRKLRYMASTVM